jgi:hypothetical protein
MHHNLPETKTYVFQQSTGEFLSGYSGELSSGNNIGARTNMRSGGIMLNELPNVVFRPLPAISRHGGNLLRRVSYIFV